MAATVSLGAFYQLPKSLFAEEKYQGLSNDAKLLYTMMRDRYRLSIQNNWKDTLGVYIRMTRKAICDLLKRSEPTVRKIIAELREIGLIIEKRVGLTQCNKIYVQLFEGESESTFHSTKKVSADSATKPDYVPERKPFTPNKNYRKIIQFRKLTSKPDFPQNGDIWEENGECFTYHHGYIQRYYTEELLNSIGFDPYKEAREAAK